MRSIAALFSLHCLLFLILISSRTSEATDANKNLRSNDRHREEFRRQIASKKDDENDDCSIDLYRDGISPKETKRASVAIKLARLTSYPDEADDETYNELFDGQGTPAVYYESGVDAVYTARIRNEFCVVAFRATKMEQDNSVKDFRTNIDTDPVAFEMGATSKKGSDRENDSLCDVHKGYHDAYFDFEYRPSIEDFLQTCSEECPECDIVLTGHSQGGGIAEVAALYYKEAIQKTPENLYVITFGSLQALGAGCVSLFQQEERCRIFRYVMVKEGIFGTGIVYDPIPMVYPRILGDLDNDGVVDTSSLSNTYARHGGLAFLGHEMFLNAEDPSSLTMGPFDGHHAVATSKYDLTTESHESSMYLNVIHTQNQMLAAERNDRYLPTKGFSLGSLCNKDESDFHCVEGISECKRNGRWWWSENTCQRI